MNLIDEYLQVTGRPAFTLTADEFLKLKSASLLAGGNTGSESPTLSKTSNYEETPADKTTVTVEKGKLENISVSPIKSISDKKADIQKPVSKTENVKKEENKNGMSSVLTMFKKVPM